MAHMQTQRTGIHSHASHTYAHVQVRTRLVDGKETFDGIVWADSHQVKTFQLYPEVLSLDSTGMYSPATCTPKHKSYLRAQKLSRIPLFPHAAKTNNRSLPLFLAVGMDGNGKSFVVFGALTLNETAAAYTWVFETAKKLVGTMACSAVHYIVSDDDHGEKSALMRKV